jgi:hypothetical protein
MGYKQVFMRATALILTLVTCAQGYVIVPAAEQRAKQTEFPARPTTVSHVIPTKQKNRAAVGHTGLPLMFEANRGQIADGRVQFISRNRDYTLFLTTEGATLSLRARPSGNAIRMKLDGANRSAHVAGEVELEGRVNYIKGRDPRSWRTGVETYERVRYRDVYKGVDLVYYSNQGDIEYDFVAAPGANPKAIRFTLEGAPVSLNMEGELVLQAVGGDLKLKKPTLYQHVGGVRKEVEGGYVLGEKGTVRFRVGRYDRTKPLVIDPVLSYATFFGGESDNSYETDIAVDSQGSAYVVGFTSSPDIFPTTPGAFRRWDTEQDGDTFVAKLTPDGSSFVYSTFIGSAYGGSIAVDAAGNAYVTGLAGKDFPVRNGFQTAPAESSSGPELVDAFVAKLNANGSDILYSSFLGGNEADLAFSVAVDAQGNAYVSGETASTNFPVTQGAARTTNLANNNFFKHDGFVTKVNTNATGAASLVYSTYADVGRAVAVDSQGNVYAAGNDVVYHKQSVIKLNPSGTAFVYNFAVNGDASDNSTRALWYVKDIAVDSHGSAYITGSTQTSSSAFPTMGGFQTSFGGGQLDAFMAKLDASGASVVYSTYLGGGGNTTNMTGESP